MCIRDSLKLILPLGRAFGLADAALHMGLYYFTVCPLEDILGGHYLA